MVGKLDNRLERRPRTGCISASPLVVLRRKSPAETTDSGLLTAVNGATPQSKSQNAAAPVLLEGCPFRDQAASRASTKRGAFGARCYVDRGPCTSARQTVIGCLSSFAQHANHRIRPEGAEPPVMVGQGVIEYAAGRGRRRAPSAAIVRRPEVDRGQPLDFLAATASANCPDLMRADGGPTP